MPIRFRLAKDACVVPLVMLTVTDELDMATVERLRTQVDRVVRLRPRWVVLDLSNCPFVDACGVRSLLQAAQQVRVAGGRLTVSDPPPIVRLVLATTGVSDLLGVTPPRRPA